jgi:hypothetical protein
MEKKFEVSDVLEAIKTIEKINEFETERV